jgi:hypothetical protein
MKKTNIGNRLSDYKQEPLSNIIREIKTGFAWITKCTFIVVLLFFNVKIYASDAINYQAIIRNTNGSPVANTLISVQITLLNDLVNENVVYQETHQVTTNDLGMINLKIGLGTATAGVFDQINWGASTFYVRTGVDSTGGTNFEVIGTSQLLSVPYALYAKKAKELDVANLTDTQISDLASKLNLTDKATVVDPKITNTDYTPIAETKDVVVYQAKGLANIEAVLGKTTIKRISSTQFQIGENGINGTFDTNVYLNNQNFPNLISGSSILKIILLPWNRNATNPIPMNGWRCCVITSNGQIYHNFPNRTPATNKPDGDAMSGDINRWDESVVWDLPNRRLPSKTSDVFPYTLNPCLPEDCYNLYPKVNSDNGYGNGGFDVTKTQLVSGKSINYPRFYLHKRTANNNPFFFMGGFETSNKIQIIGTYRSNVDASTASRVCVFITTDGGRQWYNRYEFALDHPLNFGNALIVNTLNEDYVPYSLSLIKRDFIFPSSANKEPVNLFSYGGEIAIKSILKSDKLTIVTDVPHNLKTGDLIVVKQNNISSVYNFLCNTNINTLNGGNGKIWKVEVIDPTSLYLYEYLGNPDSNLPVRHIHAINKIKDGYIISTGEDYPEGWIVYLQIKLSDTYSIVNAWDNFNFIRLNSTNKSIQRTLGTIMIDDSDQTIVFGSDEALINGQAYSIDGRTTNITRSSTGVYKGKLADIDDFSKFTCIYEAKQVAYFFKEINGMWIFAGQQGELAISVDKGLTWRTFNISGTTLAQQYPKGTDDAGRYVLDQLIIYRK